MKKIPYVLATLAALVAASLVVPSAAQAQSTVQCIAHRGYTGTGATENTTEAVDAAAAARADWVETDVQFTSSNYPVIMHDDTVDRTTDGTGKVSSMTVAQFTALHTDDGGHPPTLWAMMHQMDVDSVKGVIELKTNPTATQWSNLVGKIPSGMKGKFVFHSFNSDAEWTALHAGYPSWRLLEVAYNADWVWEYPGIDTEYTVITPSYVSTVHSHGLTISAWTVDNHADIDQMFAAGVDYLTSDDTPYCVAKRDGTL